MAAKVNGSQLVIIFSLVLVGLGLLTPLPYQVFSTVGVFGVLFGWLMDIRSGDKKTDEDNSDISINVTDTHPVNFDERLRKLSQLKEEGLVSDEEYETKRREIMEEKW